MKILITGGAGFLGSHLSRRLLQESHEVICVDNFYSSSRRNILDLYDYPNFEMIRHDITQPLYFEVDAVFNFACPASPVHYQRDPVHTMKTNVHGTINMLDLALRSKARFFQASTSEVYGNPEVSPQPESYWGRVNPIGIRSCYDEGKRAAETLCFDFGRQYGLPIQVARFFNTYGPGMALDDGRVVSNFIVQALQNEPITIYGSGNQTRSFCYVDDLISGIFALFLNPSIQGPINLGNPQEISVLELATEIISATNSKSEIIFLDLPSDDPTNRKPDITIAKTTLNWEPKYERKDGLRNTIEYFEKLLTPKN